MDEKVIFFLSIVVTVLVFLFAIIAAWYLLEFIKKMRLKRVKVTLSNIYRYLCLYLTEDDLGKDPAALKLSSISYPGYVDSTYGKFYKNLSVDHFPITVLVNWTRTIVEDLSGSVSPINHLKGWSDYFHSQGYKDIANGSIHPDIIDFEEHELAYLWGAVYYWLKCILVNYNNEELFNHIEKIAIKKDFLRPYFYHYKCLADGIIYNSNDSNIPTPMSNKGELTAEQTALLWLAIAQLTEENVVKKSLAPAISRVTGVGETSIRTKIVGSFKEEDKKVVASIFTNTMPRLAEKIMKM